MKEQVISRLDFAEDIDDVELRKVIDEVISQSCKEGYMSLNSRWLLHTSIYDSIRGLGVLQELLDDDDITEIMVNDKDNIFIEKKGTIQKADTYFDSNESLEEVIQQIVGSANKRVNQATPIVDTRLRDGSRVNVVLNPISINGSAITIRKFPKEAITMGKLISIGSITYEAAQFLKKLVTAKYNLIISGGTSSGKTTFLNALSNYIPTKERIITIEDSAELRLQNISNIVRLEVRQKNDEGENGVSMRELIKSSLRMRPDRIIVGEVRGGEALDMLQAMNTGHDGSMSTGHANSAKDMLARIETMVLMASDLPLAAVRSQISSGVDIIVHLGRQQDHKRRVIEIDEMIGYEDGSFVLNQLYVTKKCEKGYTLEPTGNKLQNTWKLEMVANEI